ncbi:unnamed protein product [Angiostrongylus costaricensis]|uniref:MARVEL domain-containing protein n=1 Tax=Angiostrongylus costaricensis TaxID=334426 RepID=A0A0R3PE31_ANGCS|nr:unnamed protein product [Angiostrongylus costaricensis]
MNREVDLILYIRTLPSNWEILFRLPTKTKGFFRIAHKRRPSFECWNLVTVTSGLRIFQLTGSVSALILIGAAGSHFCATYAAMATSALASIASTTFILVFVFNLQIVATSVDWIFWESLYSGSFAFLFLINVIVMTYSSIRWGYTTWWLATVCWIVKENSATLFFSTK